MKGTFVFILVFKCPCSRVVRLYPHSHNRSRPLHQRAECGTVLRVMDGTLWLVIQYIFLEIPNLDTLTLTLTLNS